MTAHRPVVEPIRLAAESFEEIEPVTREDGRVLRRFKLKGTELILVEEPNRAFDVSEIKVQPMPVPNGNIFFFDYVYGEKTVAEMAVEGSLGAEDQEKLKQLQNAELKAKRETDEAVALHDPKDIHYKD